MHEKSENRPEKTGMCKHGNFPESCALCQEGIENTGNINIENSVEKLPAEKAAENLEVAGVENGEKIIELKSRVIGVLDSAITLQKELSSRLDEFYKQEARKILDSSDEFATLRAMNAIGIDVDQDQRDFFASRGSLLNIKSRAETFFNNLLTKGAKEQELVILEKMVAKLKSHIDHRMGKANNFVTAIESGVDRIQARTLLSSIEDFNFDASL